MGIGILKHGKTLLSLVIFMLCGCMQQLKDFNSTLSRTNAALSPGSSITSVSNMPQMSEPQIQALHSQLITKVNDNAILHAREEAKGNIEKVLSI